MLNKIKRSIFRHKKALLTTTDLHSHLIPELDDGCQSIEESLKFIGELKKLGFKKLILTPHIMKKKYPNDIKKITYGLFELRSMLKVKNIDIKLEAAAEYYCDEHFLSLINKKEILTFGKDYVLFELAYTIRPIILEKCIIAMIRLGYKPVLAHPERYRFLKEVLDFRALKKLGLFFQVNLNSLAGYYGKEAQKKSLMLAQKGMVDFIGSDIHHTKHMESFKNNLHCNQIEILFSNNKILNDTI